MYCLNLTQSRDKCIVPQIWGLRFWWNGSQSFISEHMSTWTWFEVDGPEHKGEGMSSANLRLRNCCSATGLLLRARHSCSIQQGRKSCSGVLGTGSAGSSGQCWPCKHPQWLLWKHECWEPSIASILSHVHHHLKPHPKRIQTAPWEWAYVEHHYGKLE